MRLDSALRESVRRRLEAIERADLLVGIPCYNNEKTIAHVLVQSSEGLRRHFPDHRSVLFISDGGSTDDTREVVSETPVAPWQEKVISPYRGLVGKGTAFRAIFEAADFLGVKAVAVLDSDLRSITPEWIRFLLEPVLKNGYEFVSPVYARYKYDGTITNNVAYNFMRALYGKRVRQPIGGDFGLAPSLTRFCQSQDVWDTAVAKYGVDIWLSIVAVSRGARVCQANLGVKIHDAKDPGADLSAMFSQVVMTLFSCMEKTEGLWRGVKGSTPVETFGMEDLWKVLPEPFPVNQDRLIEHFRLGFQLFGGTWREVLDEESFRFLETLRGVNGERLLIPYERWARILYDFACTFHSWPDHRFKLVNIMSPLYNARVASFINQTRHMDSREAEAEVEAQAKAFEKEKDYLLARWNAHVAASRETKHWFETM